MREALIREAASVLVVREGDAGPELLVVERAAQARFLPGYVAFPGGAVDPGDRALATRWFGDPAHAPRATALRELLEEVGLALTADGARSADPEEPLATIDRRPPAPTDLVEIARWLAPPDVPVRFDAHFYVALAAGDPDLRADGREVARAWWMNPSRLLDGWSRGDHRLYWPTWFTVVQLAACGSAAEVLAVRIDTREPSADELARLPASVFEQDAP